jgi:tetratricopeptide (TPR) repeat protein
MLGRLSEAEDVLRKSLRRARDSGNRWGIGLGLEQMALIAQSKGDWNEAHQMLDESVELHRKVGDLWSLSRALNAMSQLNISCRELDEAERHAMEGLQSAIQGEFYSNALDTLATLAQVYAIQEKYLASMELTLFVMTHASSTRNAMATAEKLYADLLGKLASREIEAARLRAQSTSLQTFIQSVTAH